MDDAAQLDETYHFIMSVLVERGQAPHFTEIASKFAISVEEGKQRLHNLMAARLPNWLFPETDLITSFAPFHNLPTQYRVSIDGTQRWFAQCGLESLAMTWVFPGKLVTVNAPCLDCGEPLSVDILDGVIQRADPGDITFYVDLPVREWYENIPYT